MVQAHQGVAHPVRQILGMNFLGFSPAGFFRAGKPEYHPFGNGPWPCLNKIAPHYKDLVISTCMVTKVNGMPVPKGYFECPQCGFAYTRQGPDCKEEDRYRYTKLMSLGPYWETQFGRLNADQNLSSTEIARRLHVDVGTVIKRQRMLRTGSKRDIRQERARAFEKRRAIRRKRWGRIVLNHPNMSRKDLYRFAPQDYLWLYNKDRAWLMDHLPERRPRKNYGDFRVDWRERDQILKEEVVRAAMDLRQQPGKPKRITIQAISGHIGRVIILVRNSLEKLPETKASLETVLESVEEFRIRRLRYVVRALQEEGKPLSLWRVLSRAGIRPGCSDRVAEEIRRVVAGEVTGDDLRSDCHMTLSKPKRKKRLKISRTVTLQENALAGGAS